MKSQSLKSFNPIRETYFLEIRKLLESTSFALKDIYKQDYGRFVAKVIDQRDGITKVLKVLDESIDSKEKADLEHLISKQICLHGNPQHIVRILDEVFSIRGRWAFLMEAGGYSLQTIFNHFKQASHMIEPQAAIDYLEQICNGVIEIHNIGYSHNDIKPANIIAFQGFDDNVVLKVGDFGSSKEQAATTNTQEGTIGYMAPENLFNEKKEFLPASDVFSLSVMAYEMLHPNFKKPYNGFFLNVLHDQKKAKQVLEKALQEIDVSDKIKNSLSLGLDMNPANRFQTVREFICSLKGRNRLLSTEFSSHQAQAENIDDVSFIERKDSLLLSTRASYFSIGFCSDQAFNESSESKDYSEYLGMDIHSRIKFSEIKPKSKIKSNGRIQNLDQRLLDTDIFRFQLIDPASSCNPYGGLFFAYLKNNGLLSNFVNNNACEHLRQIYFILDKPLKESKAELLDVIYTSCFAIFESVLKNFNHTSFSAFDKSLYNFDDFSSDFDKFSDLSLTIGFIYNGVAYMNIAHNVELCCYSAESGAFDFSSDYKEQPFSDKKNHFFKSNKWHFNREVFRFFSRKFSPGDLFLLYNKDSCHSYSKNDLIDAASEIVNISADRNRSADILIVE